MADRCQTCRFWREDSEFRDEQDAGWGFGWCRRHPPRVIEAIVEKLVPLPSYAHTVDVEMDAPTALQASLHPATHSTGWCGEYEDKEPWLPV